MEFSNVDPTSNKEDPQRVKYLIRRDWAHPVTIASILQALPFILYDNIRIYNVPWTFHRLHNPTNLHSRVLTPTDRAPDTTSNAQT